MEPDVYGANNSCASSCWTLGSVLSSARFSLETYGAWLLFEVKSIYWLIRLGIILYIVGGSIYTSVIPLKRGSWHVLLIHNMSQLFSHQFKSHRQCLKICPNTLWIIVKLDGWNGDEGQHTPLV